MKKSKKRLISWFMILVLSLATALPVNAVTLYESDGVSYDEGYIFLGESHVYMMAEAMGGFTDMQGNVIGLDGVRFHYRADDSLSVNEEGYPNTFTMSGNLFYVFEGWGMGDERSTQISKEYIYSDGKGKRGRGVEKIHGIMDGNPNIRHWNIIAYQGAAIDFNDETIGDYYVKSYQNWINYEFPEADCYFLSMSTMTKAYRGQKYRNRVNDALAAAFPGKYLDYMDFFLARYPQGMLDPQEKPDTLHWSATTYIELATDVIRNIQQRRGILLQQDVAAGESVTDVQAVFYTNDKTVIYAEPSLNSNIILPFCEAGLPIQVTGIMSNGFLRVCVSPDGTQSYVPGTGLSVVKE